MTGEYINTRKNTVADLTVGGGIGSSLLTAKKPEGLETITPKPLPSMVLGKERSEQPDNNRPPLYVPT
jgi:hypothetical protein